MISELIIIYLFIIPSSVPHTMGDQLPVGSVNGPGGTRGKGLCPEHTPGLGNVAALGWDPPVSYDGTHGPSWPCSATLVSLALLLLQVDD